MIKIMNIQKKKKRFSSPNVYSKRTIGEKKTDKLPFTVTYNISYNEIKSRAMEFSCGRHRLFVMFLSVLAVKCTGSDGVSQLEKD